MTTTIADLGLDNLPEGIQLISETGAVDDDLDDGWHAVSGEALNAGEEGAGNNGDLHDGRPGEH